MGCFSDREKGPPSEEAQWTYITLSDFRCTSAWTVVAYVWLWFLAGVGVAVYVVDTYTAVNLLAFNHWSSQVQPKLAFQYSKWIFAVCILLSWALCIYEFIRAIRVIKRGGVAESFLDPLAVNIQSMRQKGWKRFLVFTELTKSKKGADYVALFVYFSFKNALRVILAEGPRQVVNALTLYAVMEAQLLPGSTQDDTGAERNNFDQFWFNVQTLADEDKRQAVVYFAMLFTLCIWVFSALSLIISFVMYIFFLWHYIPQRDGRLSAFCKRKVDKRLAKIVEHKVRLGIEKEQRQAEKAARKAELQRHKTGEETPPIQAALKKQPTLPDIGVATESSHEKPTPLSRQDTSATVATLPPYSVRPPPIEDTRQPTLPRIETAPRPGMPNRSATQSSGWSAAPSYSTNAPLLANQSAFGQSDPATPFDHWPTSSVERHHEYFPASSVDDRQRTASPVSRTWTPNPAGQYNPDSRLANATPTPQWPGPSWPNRSLVANRDPYASRPAQHPHDPRQFRPPLRANTSETADVGRAQPQQHPGFRGEPRPLQGHRSFSRPLPPSRTQTPIRYDESPILATAPILEPSQTEVYELQPQRSRMTPAPQPKAEYVAYKPAVHSNTPPPSIQTPPSSEAVASRSSSRLAVESDGRDTLGLSHPDVRNSNYANDILDEYRPRDSSGVEVLSTQYSGDGVESAKPTAGDDPHSQTMPSSR